MKNYIQEGDVISGAAPYARNSGEGALLGTIFGVAVNTVANGAIGKWMTEGVFALPKVTGTAWTLGAKLYWDNAAKNVTTTSAGNTLIGVAVPGPDGTTLPAAGATTGWVRLGIVA